MGAQMGREGLGQGRTSGRRHAYYSSEGVIDAKEASHAAGLVF
jgi:hypothetical protein